MPKDRKPPTPELHLAASAGGHLELLERLGDAWAGRPVVWVTVEGARARSLATRSEAVRTLPPMDRRNLALRSLLRSAALAARERPRVVVTSGAGVVLPFCLVARLFGARIVFVETMARVTSGSLTGRILSRVAHRVFVQWPELRAQYPSATVCRPKLLDDVGAVGAAPTGAAGTFVSVGSHDKPFDRLLRAVADAAADGTLPAPVVVQAGAGHLDHADLDVRAFVAPEEFERLVRSSAVVVSHAGAGALATMLRAGRRPLAMARLLEHGEHVDDHQVQLVRKLASLGLVVEVGDAGIQPADVARAAEPMQAADAFDGLPDLAAELSAAVEDAFAR